jgi:stearoyl-CoA desaturase (Delta-9 desaturase)
MLKGLSNMEINKSKRIDWLVVFILIVYPIILASLAVWYSSNYGIGTFEIVFGVGAYYLANISVGLGYHRLWAHGAYRTNKVIEFFLALLTAGTLQGPVLIWASDHQWHHAFTDQPEDPHSPTKYKSKLLGFLWSHMGWMLVGNYLGKKVNKVTMTRLGKNKLLVWQFKYYWQLATFMNTLLPALIGYFVGGSWQYAVAGYIFIGIGRALQQQMTFCVNSVLHFTGTRKYSESTARDVWWLALFLLGENWHNFHHAFAKDYRNGHKWYHFDVHKWLIALMAKLGLARDLICTPIERIEAKRQETQRVAVSSFLTKLQLIEAAASKLAEAASQKLMSAEKSKNQLTGHLKLKLKSVEESAKKLADRAKELLASSEAFEEEFIHNAMKKLRDLEQIAISIGLKTLNISKSLSY